MSKMSGLCLVYLDATAQVSFEVLQDKLKEEFGVPHVSMEYTDEEGDKVFVGSQEELDEAMKTARAPSDLLCIRVSAQGGEAGSSGGHYRELAQVVGKERKGSAERRVPCPPKWFTPAMSENNAYLLDEISKAFNEAVVVMLETRDSAPAVTGGNASAMSGVIHQHVVCDVCRMPIFGVRYKCGNCVNYDLCEMCEAKSQQVHCPSHVFLKLKVPAPYTRSPKPLLRKNLYNLEDESGSSGVEDNSPLLHAIPPCAQKSHEDLKDELKQMKLIKKMAAQGAGLDRDGPHAMCVEKSREELKEDVKRKKLERKMAAMGARFPPHGVGQEKHELKMHKMEKKLEKLAKLQAQGIVLPGMVAGPLEGGAQDGKSGCKAGKSHRRPDKYLAATVVADRNYPQGSVIPCGKPFEKSWVVANTGTKKWKHVRLVHQVGYTPLSTEVEVPDLRPEEQTILTVEYPPIGRGQPDQITSSWRMIHKGCTPFGPTLWLSVHADKEALDYMHPAGMAVMAPQGPPLVPDMGAVLPPSVPSGPVEGVPVMAPPIQQQEEAVAVVPEGPKPCDGDFMDMTSSLCSERFVQTFEMVLTSQQKSGPTSETDLAKPCEELEDQFAGSDDEFVVVIPDCFNLEVPLPELTSLRSQRDEPAGLRDSTCIEDSFGSANICSGGEQGDGPVTGGDDGCGAGDDGCGAGDDGCGAGDDGCGVGDDGCGAGDDGCGAGDDGCGAGDDGCGAGDDGCGAGDDGCGAGDDECGAGDDGCGAGDDGCGAGDDGCGAGDDGCGAGDDECGAGDDGCGAGEDGCGGDGCGGGDECGSVDGRSDCVVGPSGDTPAPSQQGGAVPSSDTNPLPPTTTARTGTGFTLQEMTLRRVIDARITNPFTVATAAINSAAKLVSENVLFAPSRPSATPPSAEDDKFEDAPEPTETRPQPATPIAPHVISYLDRDVARFLPPTSPAWEQPKWTGPPSPVTPMDRLIAMGFANRELNTQLLSKHGNNIEAVLNELLERDSEAVRV